MKINGIFVFIIITFASISIAYPANSDGGWCDASNLCGQEMVCIGNKCFDIRIIATGYGPVNALDDRWCDSSTPCGQETVCVNNKCFDIDTIVTKYGPMNTSSDGNWCDSSNSCAQNMLCLNNECIDRNRNWGSTNSDHQNANDNEIQYYQRIKPISIDLNSHPKINYTIKPQPKHGSVQHRCSDKRK